MSMRHILFVVFTLCIGLGLEAQSHVKIGGKVTDENNHPIEFATIRIAGTAIGTLSGTKGEFSLSAPAADTIEVIISCIGYSDVKRRFIDAKQEVVLNAKLYKKTHALSELEITEYKKQVSQMQQLDANLLKQSPDVSGGSVEAMLSTMAGVSNKNEMSSQYMVRGGSYDENSVYINGIEIYRPLLVSSGQQEGLSIINPNMVKSVSFSTGGFGAEYGDKMSSVLDIAYRQPQAFEGELGFSLQGGNVTIGQSTKNFSHIHGVRYRRNATLLSSLQNKGEYDPQYFDYQTMINATLGSRWKLSVLGNIAINNYRFTPKTRETSFGTAMNAKRFTVYFDGYEKDIFETYFGALSLDYKPHANTTLQLSASAYRSDELVSYDIHGEYWLDQAGTTEGNVSVGGELGVGKYHEHARNRLRSTVLNVGLKGITKLGKSTLSYGASMKSEKIYDNTREWEWRDSAGYSVPHLEDRLHVVYNQASLFNINSSRISAFVQDVHQFSTSTGLFVANLGARLSYWNFNKELTVSPRFSLGFVPARNEQLSFRLATGLYYQAPFYKEYRIPRTDIDGNGFIELNRNIKSQRSLQFIVGGDYTFRALNRPFKFTAEAYFKGLSKLIPYEVDNLKLVYSGTNSSSGYITGVDFKFFGQFVEGTDSWISFSLMKTNEKLGGKNVPLPTDQRYSIALFFTDYLPRLPKLRFSLRGVFSDGLPTVAPRSTRNIAYFRTPAYKRVDIGASYEIFSNLDKSHGGALRQFKRITVGVDVFNLFNISNVSSYYWVTDVNNLQYAVPNYLTQFQINARLAIEF